MDKYRKHSDPKDHREFRSKEGVTPTGKKYSAYTSRNSDTKKTLQTHTKIETPLTSRTKATVEKSRYYGGDFGNTPGTFTKKNKVTSGMRRDETTKKGNDVKVKFEGNAPKLVRKKK